jgi:hypothetical protein
MGLRIVGKGMSIREHGGTDRQVGKSHGASGGGGKSL